VRGMDPARIRYWILSFSHKGVKYVDWKIACKIKLYYTI